MGSYNFSIFSNQLRYWRKCQKRNKKEKWKRRGKQEAGRGCLYRDAVSLSQGESFYSFKCLPGRSQSLYLGCALPQRTLQPPYHQSCFCFQTPAGHTVCTEAYTHIYAFHNCDKRNNISGLCPQILAKPVRISRMIGVSFPCQWWLP